MAQLRKKNVGMLFEGVRIFELLHVHSVGSNFW